MHFAYADDGEKMPSIMMAKLKLKYGIQNVKKYNEAMIVIRDFFSKVVVRACSTVWLRESVRSTKSGIFGKLKIKVTSSEYPGTQSRVKSSHTT